MDSIIYMITRFTLTIALYFIPLPIIVFAVSLFVSGAYRMIKHRPLQTCFFVKSDLLVALGGLPFWGICTILPGAASKSMANLLELRILGYIWGGFLLFRLVLALCNIPKYKQWARYGNYFMFILCIVFVYFFPHLPE